MAWALDEQVEAFLAAAEQLRKAIVDTAGERGAYYWGGRKEYRVPIRDLAERTGISKSTLDRILRGEQDLVPPALRSRASRRRDVPLVEQLAGQTALDVDEHQEKLEAHRAAARSSASPKRDASRSTSTRTSEPRPPKCPSCGATGKHCRRPTGAQAIEWHAARTRLAAATSTRSRSRDAKSPGAGQKSTSTRSRTRDEEPHDERTCHEHGITAIGTLTTDRGGRRRVCRQAGCGDYFATAWAPAMPKLWCVNVGGPYTCAGSHCRGCREIKGWVCGGDVAIWVDLDTAV